MQVRERAIALPTAGLMCGVMLLVSMPKAKAADDMLTTIAKNPSLTTLNVALKTSGATRLLATSDGPFTLFAPTDAAFKKLSTAKLVSLLNPDNAGTNQAIFYYHLIPFRALKASDLKHLKDGSKILTSTNGKSVTISNKKQLLVDNAKFEKTDIITSQGVIHLIDTVLMPK